MKKALVVIGGMRVGDCAHLIPFFDSIRDKDVDWVTGTYERKMAELIRWMYPNISSVDFLDDGFPSDLNDRIRFKDNFYKQFNQDTLSHKYDDIYDDYTVSFDISPLYWKLKDNYFPMLKSQGDYIVYHLDTVSDWKKHSQIRDFKSPLPGYTLGTTNEFILPNTQNFTNQPLTEVVNLIANARMFVGIHSAMTCLNFYINKTPSVVIHPMDGLLKFSDFRSGWIDLVKPTTEQLNHAIYGILNK